LHWRCVNNHSQSTRSQIMVISNKHRISPIS
jgi:hypothetical protein